MFDTDEWLESNDLQFLEGRGYIIDAANKHIESPHETIEGLPSDEDKILFRLIFLRGWGHGIKGFKPPR